MNQSQLLIDTLKRYLKLKGIRYQDLAKAIGQTEANIKRIFSQKTLSLAQLEKMCEAASTDLFELVTMASSRKPDLDFFSEEQEKILAADPKLFAFFYVLLAGGTLEKIERKYVFSKLECQRFLIKLDKLGLIKLNEGNRYQVLVSKNVRWLEKGPLNAIYHERIRAEFMDSRFNGAEERMRFLSARFSDESLFLISRRMDKFISEFRELAEIDRQTETGKRTALSLVIAYRPWSFSVVESYRRK